MEGASLIKQTQQTNDPITGENTTWQIPEQPPPQSIQTPQKDQSHPIPPIVLIDSIPLPMYNKHIDHKHLQKEIQRATFLINQYKTHSIYNKMDELLNTDFRLDSIKNGLLQFSQNLTRTS
jgi:hypothetical protein